TTLICTDKTGTLTANRMRVNEVVTAAEILGTTNGAAREASRVQRLAGLASEPPVGDRAGFSDPMDQAVWRASPAGWPAAALRFSFDSSRRLASGIGRLEGQAVLGVKGSPEAVLKRATGWQRGGQVEKLDGEVTQRILDEAFRLAADGGRV